MTQACSEGTSSDHSAPVRSRFATGARSSFIANVAIFSAASLQAIVILRLLSKENFGTYSIVRSIWDVAATLAGGGVGIALVKFAAQYRATDRGKLQPVTSSAIALGLITTSAVFLALLFCARSMAVYLYKEPPMTAPIMIASFAVALTVLYNQFLSLLQGFEKIVIFNRIRVLHYVATLLLAAVLTYKYGVSGTFLGLLAGSGFALAFSFFFALKAARASGISLVPRFHSEALKELLDLVIPTFFSSLAVFSAFWFGRSAIVWWYGDLSDVARFGVGNSVSQVLLMTIPEAIAVPLIPLISNLNATDPQRAKALTARVFRVSGLITLFATLVVATLARVGTPLVLGRQYSNEHFIVFTMCVSAFCVIVRRPIACYIVGVGKIWLILAFDIFWVLVFVPSSWVFVRRYGPEGLACAYLLSYLVYFAVAYLYARARMGFPWRDSAVLAAVALLSLTASYFVLKYNLSVVATVLLTAVISTSAASAIFFSYRRDERREVIDLLRRLLFRREPA